MSSQGSVRLQLAETIRTIVEDDRDVPLGAYELLTEAGVDNISDQTYEVANDVLDDYHAGEFEDFEPSDDDTGENGEVCEPVPRARTSASNTKRDFAHVAKDDTPDDLTDTDEPEQYQEAFRSAIEFFHSRLDTTISVELRDDDGNEVDVPDTPREYFRARGWTDETIDRMKLGWAPASPDGLINHLMRQGFGMNAIRATGLFTESNTPLWTGRFILPYLDRDGRPVYCISRSLDDRHDGHPADGFGNQKYTKPAHTKPYVYVDEPIFGQHTLDREGPLIVTEGIADAITADEAGYAVLSPVTTAFKKKHYGQLHDLIEDSHHDRVIVIQDSELVQPDYDHDDERLDFPAISPGLRGAISTAAWLADRGIDARLGEIPRCGLSKVDLDDYLNVWSGYEAIDAIVLSAKPASEHRLYERAYDRQEIERQRTNETVNDSRSSSGGSSGRSGTKLFDLSIRDVCGFDAGDRGTNPLGHTGESEDYFVAVDDSYAYDHKRKVGYAPLTYLLVACDERDVGRPNGSVSDREMLEAWAYAKDEGMVSSDDPVPHNALRYLGCDVLGLCDPSDLADGWKLPTDVFNDAIDHLEETYGVEAGREKLSVRTIEEDADIDPELVSTLPIRKLEALTPSERRQRAREKGAEWPTTDEARKELYDAIQRELWDGNKTLLDAPTSLGKSHTVATEPWMRRMDATGGRPVIHLHKTTDARDEANDASRRASGVSSDVILGREEACPLVTGQHDPSNDEVEDPVIAPGGMEPSEWFDVMCNGRGIPFSSAHQRLRAHCDDELPCCEDGDCPAIAQWDHLPTNDDSEPVVDVIHATHQFAHVPSVRAWNNLVMDEQPDYVVYNYNPNGEDEGQLSQDRIRRAVSAFLNKIGAPHSTFENFVSSVRHSPNDGDAGMALRATYDRIEKNVDIDPDWYFNEDDAHTLAPVICKALYYALRPTNDNPDPFDDNHRASSTVTHEPPRLDANAGDDDYWNSQFVKIVVDANNTIRRIRTIPDFRPARAVVCLDAHPTLEMWRLNTTPKLNNDAVLPPEKRRLWRRFERGLRTVQIGEATRSIVRPDRFSEGKFRAIAAHLHDEYDGDFRTGITALSVEDDVRRIMREVGIVGPKLMHYGEEKSRNDFADETIGMVVGCIDPGDDFVFDSLAELEANATAERRNRDVPCPSCEGHRSEETCDTCACGKCEGDGCQSCLQTGYARAYGRGWVGPDAHVAKQLLASVRENHVAQAAGRYARNANNPASNATVYIWTDAAPDGMIDMRVPGVKRTWTQKQRYVVEALRDATDGVTATEIADNNDIAKRTVQQYLKELADQGLITRNDSGGAFSPTEYEDNGELPAYGIVVTSP